MSQHLSIAVASTGSATHGQNLARRFTRLRDIDPGSGVVALFPTDLRAGDTLPQSVGLRKIPTENFCLSLIRLAELFHGMLVTL